MKKKKLLSQSSSSRLFLALGDRIWEQFNVGPLGFASTFGEGDIVKQDFIAVDGEQKSRLHFQYHSSSSSSAVYLMGLKWEFLPADGLGTELFRAYFKSRPDDEPKRKMINDFENSGDTYDENDVHRCKG